MDSRGYDRKQRGAVTVLAVLGLLVVLGAAALAVDLSMLVAARTQLSTAADAAALAGVKELPFGSRDRARTRAAVDLLTAGRVADFGALMNECHASLRDLYEVSCPELDALAEAAQRLDGCYGARLTGAGFGGCTVNLVAAASAEAFTRDLAGAYQQATGRHAAIWVCQAAGGAGVIQTSAD